MPPARVSRFEPGPASFEGNAIDAATQPHAIDARRAGRAGPNTAASATSSPTSREGRATAEEDVDNKICTLRRHRARQPPPPPPFFFFRFLFSSPRARPPRRGPPRALLVTARRRVAADRLQRVFRRRARPRSTPRARPRGPRRPSRSRSAQSQPQGLLLVVRLRELRERLGLAPDDVFEALLLCSCWVPSRPHTSVRKYRRSRRPDLTGALVRNSLVAYFTSLPWRLPLPSNRPPDRMSVLSSSRCSSDQHLLQATA